MDVTTERQDGVLSAQVGGRIDGTNAAEFEEAIRTAIEEPAFLRAPRRRVTPVEEGSTQTVVGLIW